MTLIDIAIGAFFICSCIGFLVGAVCFLIDAHKDKNR